MDILVEPKIMEPKIGLVRVRVELMTLALSAPRSADWANEPETHSKQNLFDL